MRGVIAIRDYSDAEYFQDFERNFDLASTREILSRAFLTKNWDVNSLNLRFERSETFLGATVLQERMPTLEFFRRTSEIGQSPVYFSMQSSLSNLFINRGPGFLHGGYGRADFHPDFSIPWKGLPWLSVSKISLRSMAPETRLSQPLSMRSVPVQALSRTVAAR